MKQAIIIANGSMQVPPELSSYVQASTLIIAADGGIHNCKSLGIQPNVIIGDLDSVGSGEVAPYQESGVDVIAYPPRKDETDLELALRYALKSEVTDVIILGGLGARWDMTIANIHLIAHPMFAGLHIRLLDGTQELRLLRAGNRSVIHGRSGDTLSLIPLAGDVSGIITSGLEYQLNDETLHFGSSRGVSNVLIQDQADILFRQGVLLCIVNKAGN
jgi:thiamine pyrophosphokinase